MKFWKIKIVVLSFYSCLHSIQKLMFCIKVVYNDDTCLKTQKSSRTISFLILFQSSICDSCHINNRICIRNLIWPQNIIREAKFNYYQDICTISICILAQFKIQLWLHITLFITPVAINEVEFDI